MSIIDVSDPTSPTLEATYDPSFFDVSDPVSPTCTGSYTVSDYIYDVALMDDLAYLAADNAGLHVVDVSDPVSPTVMGVYDEMDEVQAVVLGVSESGRTLAYIAGEDEGNNVVSVLDVSDSHGPSRGRLPSPCLTSRPAPPLPAAAVLVKELGGRILSTAIRVNQPEHLVVQQGGLNGQASARHRAASRKEHGQRGGRGSRRVAGGQ